MSPARSRALDSFLTTNSDLEVRVVTSRNVDEFVVPGHPLHPAYGSLSTNHRSDYLRCYLLHHHGGGYTDVKAATASWKPVFDLMDRDPGSWVVGYPEPSSQIADNLHGPLRTDLKRHHARLAGNGAFIVRAGTPFTAEWYAEVHRRLDYYQSDLKRSPARDPFGQTADYPVTWVGLQGLVFQPLQLKYSEHVRLDPRLMPSFAEFR